MWNDSEERAIPRNEIDWKQGVRSHSFFSSIVTCFFTPSPLLVPFHYLHQQDQRWSLMGWTIHSTVTGGIQSGMHITQAPIKLSKTFLDQSLEEEEKTGPLTIWKVNNDMGTAPPLKSTHSVIQYALKYYDNWNHTFKIRHLFFPLHSFPNIKSHFLYLTNDMTYRYIDVMCQFSITAAIQLKCK